MFTSHYVCRSIAETIIKEDSLDVKNKKTVHRVIQLKVILNLHLL